jgi:hypothetical protein
MIKSNTETRTDLCRRKWRSRTLKIALFAQFCVAPSLRDLRASAKLRLTAAEQQKALK